MAYLGSWKINDNLTFYANTHRFDTGVATDADAVPSYRVYEDETATPLLTGSMALLDSVNTAGFYSEQIALTALNGFEKGKSYAIYIAATVNSVAGAMHHTFQMEAEVDANTVSDTATVADAVWDELSTGHVDAGKAGAQVWTDVDAILADTGTDGVIVVTNNDKTGYSVGTGGIAAAAFAAAAIDAAAIAADAVGASEFAQAAADKAWSSTTRTLTQTLAIKKNTILNNFMFLMVDSTDHVTPKTGLTITAQRSIDGAAFAATANAATEVGNGVYKINLAAADLNGDVITFKFTSTGADQRTIVVATQANA